MRCAGIFLCKCEHHSWSPEHECCQNIFTGSRLLSAAARHGYGTAGAAFTGMGGSLFASASVCLFGLSRVNASVVCWLWSLCCEEGVIVLLCKFAALSCYFVHKPNQLGSSYNILSSLGAHKQHKWQNNENLQHAHFMIPGILFSVLQH